MNVLKRLLSSGKSAEPNSGDRTLDYKAFTIHFSDERTATAVLVPQNFDPERVVRLLGLTIPSSSIFISGGAGEMPPSDVEVNRQVVQDGLADYAAKHDIIVIDGGTKTGVMQLMGEAHTRNHYHFPLVGIAPIGVVEFPGHPNPDSKGTLDDGHTHFVLVEGNEWGNESQMILRLSHALSGAGKKPVLGLIINGGKVVQQEAYMATSKELNLPLLVLQGSGRFADELAAAKSTGKTDVTIVRAIVKYGNVQLVSLSDGPQGLREKLEARFGV